MDPCSYVSDSLKELFWIHIYFASDYFVSFYVSSLGPSMNDVAHIRMGGGSNICDDLSQQLKMFGTKNNQKKPSCDIQAESNFFAKTYYYTGKLQQSEMMVIISNEENGKCAE